MEPMANPIHKKGRRNLDCPHYEACLDQAVLLNWRHWMCTQCPHQNTKMCIVDVPGREDMDPFCPAPISFEECGIISDIFSEDISDCKTVDPFG